MSSADTSGRGLAARRAALEALAAVDERDAYSNLAVPSAVAALTDARDRAFASHLAYDTLRWQGTLDWALGTVLDRDLADVEPALRRILRLGALQVLRTDVPARAAVSTSAELAREAVPARRAKGAAGFVNGVLRALARATPQPEGLALATAHPEWIVEELVGRLGEQEARAALEADNDPPGLTLRAVGDRDALIAELRETGIEATPGRLAPEAVRAPGADPRRLSAVIEGRAVPQDEASMLVARATRTTPGDRVLDLCAGPGGKSTHLATLTGPTGEVVSVELHAHRARLVEEAAARLGHDQVTVVVGDGREPPVEGQFDVVLLDAPCTGLGTGRRRPEVRWRRRPEEIADLAALQVDLLRAGAERVRLGGHLTYAVCTWTRGETDEVIAAVLEPDARFERVEVVQRWPHRDDTDGMFCATYRRIAT